MRIRALLWLFLALIVTAVYVSWYHNKQFQFESDILKLLPETEIDLFTEQAFARFSNKSVKKVFFLVQHNSLKKAKVASDLLRDALNKKQWIASVGGEMSVNEQQQIGRFNFQYRHHLLAEGDREQLQHKHYRPFLDEVVEQAYSPLSNSLLGLIKDDPFLLSYRYSAALGKYQPNNLQLDGYHLVSRAEESNFVLLNATLVPSPFDGRLQSDLSATLNQIEIQWQNEGLAGAQLHRTGVVFYATHAAAKARSEITLFGGLSIILIVLLVLLVFSSIKPLVMTTLALVFGIATGFSAVQLAFGSVHLLTLVFGASLIGISVDYAFHFFASSGLTGDQRIRRIFPAITIGVFSSMVGYLILLTTPFPGLRQMGTFCIAGLFGAYLTVVLLFPILKLGRQGHNKFLPLCSRFMRLGETQVAKRIWQLSLLCIPAAIYFLLNGNGVQNDIRAFQAKNITLQQQEAVIQSVVNSPAMNQFYLIKGSSADQLIERLEKAESFLIEKKAAGVISGYISLSHWLPSKKRQKENHNLIGKLLDSDLYQELLEHGLITAQEYEDYRAVHRENSDQYVTVPQWFSSPLGTRFSYLWLGKIGEEYGAIIPLMGVTQLDSLNDLNEYTQFVDKVSELNLLLETYRVKATWMLFLAIGAIFGVLFIRMGLVKATIVISLPLTAVAIAILAITLSGQAISLFNVVALFLVAGIGVDYAVFFAEMQRESANTLLAVALSAMTTVFSFGMLSMSETLVISTFGFTVLIGICSAFLLSPVVARLTHGAVKQ